MSQQWESVETVKLLSDKDRALIAKAKKALPGLVLRLDEADVVVRGMYASFAGQPKAQQYAPQGGSEPPWCWKHERTVRECDKAGLSCSGEVVQRATDSTGEAATQPDPAAARHRRYMKCVELVTSLEREMYHLGKNHPEHASERPGLESDELGPGDGWCSSCYRLDRTYEPVAMHPDGRRRYREYCRFCGDCVGDTRTEADPDGMVPSLDMLTAHHTPGKIVTEAMFREARSAHAKVVRMRNKSRKRSAIRRAHAAGSDAVPDVTCDDP